MSPPFRNDAGSRRARRGLLSCALAACLASAAASQVEEAGGALPLVVPDGLEVVLWAESPQLFNPTAIDVDARGRVWVVEGVNYRKWDERNPGLEHPGGDRVVILEDADGDGRCDASRVFVQDPELTAPLGIAVVGERVYVACSPSLFVYVDEDGDDVPERREVLLTGFGGFDHDHGLHSPVVGPDGRLHVAVGNAGPHVVRDRDGWTLRSGSLYRGGGPALADNKPGLVSDDGRAWTGGLLLALEQDGGGLEVLAHNFRNPYEVALDSFGNLFTADNDDDGNQACRTLFCLEGGDHGFFSRDGSRTWQADRRPEQTTQAAHWHQEDPGVAPAGTINGAGAPTGVVVYEGRLLERWCGGAVLNADAGAGVVYAHLPVASGATAGIDLRPTELVREAEGGEEPAHRFRPSDVCVAPDGALFVADWVDPGVGGHGMADREGYGRILRVAPSGHRARASEAERAPAPAPTLAEALALLRSPAVQVRELGRRVLARGGEDARALLRERFAAEADARFRARCLWIAVATLGDRGLGLAALGQDDERLRVAALRALRRSYGGRPPAALLREHGVARDPSPRVRREALLALRGVPLAECRDLLLALAAGYDGADRAYLEAFGLAADERPAEEREALYAELAAELGDVPARWDERFEGLAWRLHPESAVDAFAARAADAALPRAARRRALDALAFVPARAAAETMLTLSQAGPADLRDHARSWVEHRSGNAWRPFDLLSQLPRAAFERAELAYASGTVRAGLVEVEVDVAGAETLWLVVDEAGNGNSCDWADWVEPRFEGPDATWPLTRLEWLEAEAGWGSVRVGRNTVGGPLFVGDLAVADGIGTHAPSRIAYAVPEGATRFVARAGPDRGGTSQADGAATSVRFEVRLARPPGPPPSRAWIALVDDPRTPAAEREQAVRELARDPAGGLLLCRRADRGSLAPELARIAAEEIFRNPDLGVRALASEHFRRPGEEERSFPPVAELLELDGDARRGQRLFFDQRAACSACHVVTRGRTPRGGEVGPDLTRVRDKLGRAELLDAILNPSAAIALGYDTWWIEDVEGTLHAGFLLADGEELVLKDTRGLRHVIPAADVVERTRQRLSTMPEGVALGLGPQELADLVAFLVEDPDAPVRLGEELDLLGGRGLEGWVAHLADGDARAGDVWSLSDAVLSCAGSPVGYLRTVDTFESFHLSLEWRFDPARGPGNSGVLLRVQPPDRVWPRSIEAQLHHRDAGDVWNIGEFDMEVDPDRTSGRRTERLQPCSERPVGEWNRYDIRLVRGTLELFVNGVLQNRADWCEEVAGHVALQSEGAAIEFRNVRLRRVE